MDANKYDQKELSIKIQDFLDENYSDCATFIVNSNEQDTKIDFKKIAEYDLYLAEAILDHPETIIKLFNNIILENILSLNPDYEYKDAFTIRLFDIPKSSGVSLNKIRAKDSNSLVFIEGIVKLKSNLINLITHAKFECPSCGVTIIEQQDILEPLKTPSICKCGRKEKFHRIGEDLIDFYYIDLEEPLEIIDDSNKPVSIRCWFRGGLGKKTTYRSILPGSKIKLIGYYKVKPKKTNKGKTSAMMDRYFEVNHVECLQETFEDLKYTDQDIKEFKEIAKREDWLDFLRNELFSDIKGHDEECKAVILQMFGGVKIKRKTGVDTKGNLNLFFVGDAGTSKSSILKIAQKFAPKAKYVAGSAVSGPGLIGAVIKNEFDGSWDVQAGAISLSNKGMLMIDELDKINHENKQALHEPLSEECYHPDTKITLGTGEVVRIGDFVQRVFYENKQLIKDVPEYGLKVDEVSELPSFTFSNKKVTLNNSNFVFMKKSPEFLYKIEFSNGHTIKVTPNHPVYCFDEANTLITKRADNVLPGLKVPFVDGLVFKESSKKFLNNGLLMEKISRDSYSFNEIKKFFNNLPDSLNSDLAEFLGVFASSGSISNNVFSLRCKNEEICERMIWVFNKYFDLEPNFLFVDEEERVLTIHDKLFIHWFEYQFGSLNSNNKKIPKMIFGDKELAKYFLSGFVQRRKNFLKINKENYSFLTQLQNLFLMFNVYTVLKKTEIDNLFLEVVSSEDFFVEVIGVKKIKSDTEWVYDVNVPLSHNFISLGGLMLHNTISFSKAGVDQVLPAEVSVLAAANPKYASFSKYDSIFEQIDMTITLFNRFDLVFVFRENHSDTEHHRELGRLIINNANKEDSEERFDKSLFYKKYISYAKTFNPKVPDDVVDFLSGFYSDLKYKNYSSTEEGRKPVPITPRNLDALRRLSQAVARSRFNEKVTLKDAFVATELLMKSLKQLGVEVELQKSFDELEISVEDPFSGNKEKLMPNDVIGIVKFFISNYMRENPLSKGIHIDELTHLCVAKGIPQEKVEKIVDKLSQMGHIIFSNNVKIKPVW